MKKQIKYPKIMQFRNVVTDINNRIAYVGKDENGDAIFDRTIPKPVLKFKGTVKLHGTNSGVSYNTESGLWAQSRNGIITPENDNAGFARFVEDRKDVFMTLVNEVVEKESINTNEYTISIYGEFAGKSIQKGVGISQIDKSMFIFGVKISKPQDEEFQAYWVDSSYLKNTDVRVFNIQDYPTYEVDVDFNMPKLSVPKLQEITEAIEKECPVAKEFGIENGVGEGAVWSIEYKGNTYRFKTKGEKHSVSKVKKLASVDVEKLNSIQEFVDYSVTPNRFEQAIGVVFGEEPLDTKKMGDLIRWMVNDIMSEETDTLEKNGLTGKDVNKYISNKTREMFFTKQNEF
jgi:hypothetical protein